MRIVLVGDDITLGLSASATENSWAGRLQEYLKKNFENGFEVINRAVAGSTAQDGFNNQAHFLEQYIDELNAGVYWADKGWKNISHYFVPGSGKGLWQFNNALRDFKYYYYSSLT
jgi:hypothetical protein